MRINANTKILKACSKSCSSKMKHQVLVLKFESFVSCLNKSMWFLETVDLDRIRLTPIQTILRQIVLNPSWLNLKGSVFSPATYMKSHKPRIWSLRDYFSFVKVLIKWLNFFFLITLSFWKKWWFNIWKHFVTNMECSNEWEYTIIMVS
jgi:flagellar biosynthesis protein FlhB